MMTKLRSWLGKVISEENSIESAPVVVTPRHEIAHLQAMTKSALLDYAREHDIFINARKRKEEIIEIIVRN